jgi:branched-chain amino acid transport system permease protein
MRSKEAFIFYSGAVCLLCVCPLFLPSFGLYLLNEILVYSLFSYGFYFLFSHAGYLSFGQAAYFALGAYSVALVYKYWGPVVWLPFLTVMVVTCAVASALGYLSVRLGKLHFAFLTLAFAQMIYSIIFRWRSFTGGDDGIPGIPRGIVDVYFTSFSLESPVLFYYFSLTVVVALVFALRSLTESSFGLTLRSIRDNPERSRFTGVNVERHVLLAFVISAVYCSVAGALHASLTKMACPEMSYWTTSAEPIIMTLLGGTSTFSGPFVGTMIYVLLKTYFMTAIGNWVLFLGVVLLCAVLLFPKGFMGFVESYLARKWGARV